MKVQKTGQTMCHIQVREVAKGIAGELYEKLMGEDIYYQEWRRQNPEASSKELERRFIERNWGKCLDAARATLVGVLKDPSVSESVKETILDVLEKDQSLRGKKPMVTFPIH